MLLYMFRQYVDWLVSSNSTSSKLIQVLILYMTCSIVTTEWARKYLGIFGKDNRLWIVACDSAARTYFSKAWRIVFPSYELQKLFFFNLVKLTSSSFIPFVQVALGRDWLGLQDRIQLGYHYLFCLHFLCEELWKHLGKILVNY